MICAKNIKTILLICLSYLLWLLIYTNTFNAITVKDSIIFITSWCGILIFIYFFHYWYKNTGELLNLFNIFLIFFLAFNFGQCLLWAFGIHINKEIGSYPLYGYINCDNNLILKSQLIFIISLIMLNGGAILLRKKPKKVKYKNINETNKKLRYKAILYTSIILFCISAPSALYIALKNFQIASSHGYSSLYYGSLAGNTSTILNIISGLFLPSSLGILIGSDYNKKARIIVYATFAIYVVITLLCGDRGEWIMKFIILFCADNQFYKKRDIKKLIILGILGYFTLYLVNAIVSLRNTGITTENVKNVLLSSEANPIVSLLGEFGSSMAVNIVLLKEQVVFPYGNTYLMSFLTMFSTNIVNKIGIEYVQLNTWFSKEYLNIKYGADFTIIGEALINFGEYLTPLIMIILGIILSKILLYDKNLNNPLSICLSLNISALIFKLSRSTTWFVLNGICYSTALFALAYVFILTLLKNKYKL